MSAPEESARIAHTQEQVGNRNSASAPRARAGSEEELQEEAYKSAEVAPRDFEAEALQNSVDAPTPPQAELESAPLRAASGLLAREEVARRP